MFKATIFKHCKHFLTLFPIKYTIFEYIFGPHTFVPLKYNKKKVCVNTHGA